MTTNGESDLTRRDQQAQVVQRLRLLITEGLESGVGRVATDDVLAQLRSRVFDSDS